ncbi:hypothetical protein HY995_00525 [Candidatus Micrarchaeota archaeon]|nr:hypothetical protein [Candidatus Micrarchaeota archaeon]MBI5176552.1 hypothetical protein [Candidatus Micrarchaeota archaeon]
MNTGAGRVVIDTNIYYQAFYNHQSRQMLLLDAAAQEKVELYSPELVREEALRTFSKAGFANCERLVEELPATWVPFELYSTFMAEASTLIRHKPDAHVVACALFLNCGILSANTRHFDTKRLRQPSTNNRF